MNEHIESLALTKDFDDLNLAERSLVLATMSEEEYTQWRSTFQAIQSLDAEVRAPAALKARVMENMVRRGRPNLFQRVLKAQSPLWLTLLLASLGWILTWTWMQRKIPSQIPLAPQVEVRRDTVWVEKTVWKDRIVIREKWRYKEKEADPPMAILPVRADSMLLELDFSAPDFTPQRVGTSLGDEPELLRFFSDVNR